MTREGSAHRRTRGTLPTPIDRGILFTADQQERSRRLDPVGSGFKEGDDAMVEAEAANAAWMPSSRHERQGDKLFSRNLLPDRRLALSRSGMDPSEALQFDRMLHDAWGVVEQLA